MAPADAGLERWVSDADGRLRQGRFGVVLTALYVVFAVTYLPINLFSIGRDASTLFFPGEDQLPFLPIFEYLYVLTYFMPFLLVVTVRDYATLRRAIVAYGIILAVAYASYLVFPVHLDRPHLEVTSLHTWLLSIEYLDPPYNHFPSLHVALSWLAVFASRVTFGPRLGLALVATGISVSTVFVKQHYFADVLYGWVLSWAAWKVSPRLAARQSG